ncbi:MAG: DTW domain-containing protein [Deltaproteobacteria bacterium]|nr:MAG: DTW domain-containing protein [Deltaproteobacteria bacterium]
MTRCPRCYLPAQRCICSDIPRVATRTRVVVIRHALERHKPSNTGRLVAYALENSELVDYGGTAAGTWRFAARSGDAVLFPARPPQSEPPAPPPRRLIVVDGTWQQARRMVQRIDALRRLPALSLPPPAVDPPRLRRPPAPGRLATLEAVARALAWLEGDDVAAPLDALYALFVARSRAAGRHRG